MLAISSTTLAASAQNVSRGMRSVPMMHYTLGAGCDSGAGVEGMTLVYQGPSPADLRRIYIKIDGKTVTKRKTIDPADRTVNFAFHRLNEPGVCSGKTVDIYADIARTAAIGGAHRLVIELAQDVFSDEGSVGVPTEGPWVTVVR